VPGGWLVVEHGDTQGEAVRRLFEQAGLTGVRTTADLAGRDRCTEGRAPGMPAGA
jgi:release factor glutamine methyltransferase